MALALPMHRRDNYVVVETGQGILRGFRDVDKQSRALDFASYLKLVSAQTAKNKSAMLDLLEPVAGQRLLDVGCGTGDDVRDLARRVAPTGTVVGVDASHAMIRVAKENAEVAGTEFRIADAHTLPFPDGVFDGARVERTLQHVEDPMQVLGEMVRVLRPGGIIVAAEPDWGTLVIDSREREGTRELVRAISDNQIRNGWIGRQLSGHFVLLGLESIDVFAGILSLRSLDLAAEIFGFAGIAGDSWLQEMRERDSRGAFFASVTGFVVKGRRAGISG